MGEEKWPGEKRQTLEIERQAKTDGEVQNLFPCHYVKENRVPTLYRGSKYF
jgi:hypothetical protein